MPEELQGDATIDGVTPVDTAQGTRLLDLPIIVPIIRAGLGMIDPALAMIPDAQLAWNKSWAARR